jgi:hypothetical protein
MGAFERLGFPHRNLLLGGEGVKRNHSSQPIEWPPVYTKDGKRIKHFDRALTSPRGLVNACIGERGLPGLLGGDVLSQGPHQS